MNQTEALSILKTGANVFLTGEPGSGKTYTVNKYIEYLKEHKLIPAVTASTGIAATHLNGMTIHSWSGIGIKNELTKRDLDKLQKNKKLLTRAQKTSVLLIDEISMLESKTLTAVDLALKTLRESGDPFGGLQVVFVGDFFQLPPISRYGEPPAKFAFESPAWTDANPIICYLSDQYRQDDLNFLGILQSIRKGKITHEVRVALSKRINGNVIDDTLTKLYSHNADVNKINSDKLSEIPGDVFNFEMISKGPKALVDQLIKSCLSPEILSLKIGAKVIFTKNNFEEHYVNGTLGEVIDFNEDGLPVVQTTKDTIIEVSPMDWSIDDGVKILATISQIPLRLSWAITVHKSQGMTLDAAVMDLSHAFEYGQGYVAISRVKSISGLFLLGYNQRALEVHPDVIAIDSRFNEMSDLALQEFIGLTEEELIKDQENFILVNGGSVKKINHEDSVELSTYDKTLKLFQKGLSVLEIANDRGFTHGTVITHLEKLSHSGQISKDELTKVIPQEFAKNLEELRPIFEKLGYEKISPIYHKLGGAYSYEDLRLARLVLTYK